MENIEITPAELQFIRSLGDFDLTMLLSEINDHGWVSGRRALGGRALLPLIDAALKVRDKADAKEAVHESF